MVVYNDDSIKLFQQANEDLRNAASVSSFRSRSIGCFRLELSNAIKQAISFAIPKASQDNSRHLSIQYSSSSFQESLNHIGWGEICRYHDTQVDLLASKAENSKANSTTPLQEIVNMLKEPALVPMAFCNVLSKILMMALLQSPRNNRSKVSSSHGSRWDYSESFLLKSIAEIWKLCPSINFSALDSLIEGSSMTKSPSKWNRLLSVLTYLVKDCPHMQLVVASFILEIVRILDDIELGSPASSTAVRSCVVCNGTTKSVEDFSNPSPQKRTKYANLSDLHEKDITTTGEELSRLRRRNYQPFYSEASVSLNAVLKSRERPASTTNCICGSERNGHQPGTMDEWALIRSRAYKKFLDLFRHHPSSNIAWQCSGYPIKVSRGRRPRRLNTLYLLQTAFQHYDSPSVRLCLVMVADSLGGRGSSSHYLTVVRSYWTGYSRTQNLLWLRFYAEFLVECAFFDTREHCWEAFRLILRFVMKEKEGSANEGFTAKKEVFSCIAYVLSHRYRLFQLEDDSLHSEFRESMTFLAINYGESKYWVDRNMLPQEARRFLKTLQRVGILGLVEMTEAMSELKTIVSDDGQNAVGRRGLLISNAAVQERMRPFVTTKCEPPLRRWPFAQPYDLRSAYRRLQGTNDGFASSFVRLLSPPGHDETLQLPTKAHNKPTCPEKKEMPRITDYLNKDILRLLFSFCGYKRLVKNREVCQTWKEIVDNTNTLWYAAYHSRFGFSLHDPSIGEDVSKRNWQTLFYQKWLVEQNIRFRRHGATGWKHRTCRYIGCLHVLRSEKRERRHYKMHLEQANKKQRKLERRHTKEKLKATKLEDGNRATRQGVKPPEQAKKAIETGEA